MILFHSGDLSLWLWTQILVLEWGCMMKLKQTRAMVSMVSMDNSANNRRFLLGINGCISWTPRLGPEYVSNCIYLCIYIYTYVYIYIYKHKYVYICIYVYIIYDAYIYFCMNAFHEMTLDLCYGNHNPVGWKISQIILAYMKERIPFFEWHNASCRRRIFIGNTRRWRTRQDELYLELTGASDREWGNYHYSPMSPFPSIPCVKRTSKWMMFQIFKIRFDFWILWFA